MESVKVLGFMTLFYGKEYLRESLLSIRDHVDKMVIAYTRNPSHGFGTSEAPVDSSLYSIEFSINAFCISLKGGGATHNPTCRILYFFI